MLKSIKIDSENYEKLCGLSGRLTEKLNRHVSINETIRILYKKQKLSDMAGKWKVTEEETKEIKKSLEKGWSNWKIRSV